ncbi:hypothetical protein EMIHUDRAFT_374088 [Emiliania huxleyi CCMP1516]|uniref:Mitochondrial cardiolipin hydrolase n=2 Tax=Emiliania huxleyi TaxID=2903 RepID=A0A0D3J1N2_EMIH1|nr:hypothetical protein EMIHUDRAFT_355894 [Emiliania huxleyi CCMP1516]XP_005769958.1 hypothetical protein EMIHUDRAFT_374088 [Emiliania huxleyi CCMP1516]EOD17417.1 hypothetical protein EMIHUDRAFT_355894 [Emiliania huxleyi CCMP1516]EOD17529.1 hypothetical protein EMIHUDRAFT_374088 [Emiliania huxleyi CCMP1516]|eukprot:XP_005769846.1 hypothetical protein EMIHUDRAFT_355894 [Emiliania huxleyi CCMP1516]
MGACLSIAGPLPQQRALFFPDRAMPCRQALKGQPCRRKHCTYEHDASRSSLMQLLAVIGDATTTLDVCVFTITCNELADAIIAAAKRKVRVRVITDDIQATSQGSDVSELARTPGVTLRTDHQKEAHMHHKFALVDGTTLVNGSFNWTRAAVLTNYENVAITSGAPGLIGEYTREFERLWRAFA